MTLKDGTIVHLDPKNASEGGRYKTAIVDDSEVKKFIDRGITDKDNVEDADAPEASGALAYSADAEAENVKDKAGDMEGVGATAVATTAARNYPPNQPTIVDKPGTAEATDGIEAGDPDAAPEPGDKPEAKPATKGAAKKG